ncbi:hypothetical protein [Aliiglaciecola sp. LCG003]|uniref:hypothetical protein n=1 Tax=Aliiglaciecola sp. LCG003 TaxID=3053655 RepID=UPI0025727D7F|nr:hypothetical protein [Aliiglaciecola sp. LCG003]WJG08690.1 hypothetical protein QR722_15285 [Aliiglaciecola sp. LCG003]
MAVLSRSLCMLVCSLIVSACGGGGSSSSGDDGGPTGNNPTPSQIIANAQDYSITELKRAATRLIDTRYTGKKTTASLDVDLSQQVFKYLFDDAATETPYVAGENFTDQVDSNGNIDIAFSCYYQGTVRYKGKLNGAFQGNLAITYSNCAQADNGFPITGSVALTINTLTETSVNLTYYFDNLGWTYDDQFIKLTGYSDFISTGYTYSDNYAVENNQYVLFSIDDQQLLLDAELDITTIDYQDSVNLTGELFIGEKGKVAFSLEDVEGFPPYISSGNVLLSADKQVTFDFGSATDSNSDFIRYLEDNDGDGNYDVGAYFVDIYELLNGSVSTKQLVALAQMSIPPSVGSPYLSNYGDINTTTAIGVEAGYYSDPDNSNDELVVSYRWYINDQLVSNQSSNTLPPYLAVYGDSVRAAVVVSDGINSTESPSLYIYLQDAPAEIKISDIPEVMKSGDVVQFRVTSYDPDIDMDEAAGTLVAGPEGAVIDGYGWVTWNVPTEFLFPFQIYDFTFSLPNEGDGDAEKIVVPIEVESDVAMPITRSGITVPANNKSMHVGDFDGDGINEVLSTNSTSSVFLLEFKDDKYQQKWVYPFKLPTKGRIVQVLKANLDEDAQQEIVVVTENGVNVIDGLDKQATALFETTEYITFATLKDIDNDGIPEMAFLSSPETYSDGYELHVVSLNAPELELFTTNVGSAKQVEFANVDDDNNLELVVNNGRVYDAVTWENQWFSGTEFGDANIALGDFNGDGIAEIAGADRWGDVSIYSAVDKSQLSSFSNFNTCTLLSEDLNNDGTDELIVGDCQWGNITAYNLQGNQLAVLWAVNMQDHGSTSLMSGDSDNDGKLELHWGTGVSSSGKDSFIAADIEIDSATIKDSSNAVQLDNYSSAGWSNITENNEKAVFFIPSTQSGYQGSRIVTLDEDGSYSLSDEISSNWDGSRHAVTTDFNNDGFGDIFVPSTDLYDGAFSVIQLYDNSTIWQVTGDYDSTIGVIQANDLNADGYDDALYADGRVLNAIDIENQTIIANYTFDNYINDFASTRINNTAVVLVSFANKLSFLIRNGAVFSEKSFIEKSCRRMALFNFDNDAQLELACLEVDQYSSSSQTLVVYELNNNTFTEVARNLANSYIYDLVADPSTDENQNLFVTTSKRDRLYDNYDNLYQIKKMTSQGNVIWSSPGLVGEPSSYGLKVRMGSNQKLEFMLSTSQMMYWIK